MGILWMMVIGLIAGALAKLMMPGRQNGGLLLTVALGVGGALLAGLVGRMLGWYDDPAEPVGLIAATCGAFAILVAYNFFTKRRLAQ